MGNRFERCLNSWPILPRDVGEVVGIETKFETEGYLLSFVPRRIRRAGFRAKNSSRGEKKERRKGGEWETDSNDTWYRIVD